MFLFFLTFEAGHVLKVVLKFWPNLRLNVLIKFVLKKKKECMLVFFQILKETNIFDLGWNLGKIKNILRTFEPQI